MCHWLCQCLHDRRLVRSLRPNVALAKLSHSNPTCKPLAGRALAKPVAHKKPRANALRLMHEACHGINQPTCVSTRFLNLLDVTCATGFASVFTIGGLYVACALTLPWQSCLTRVLPASRWQEEHWQSQWHTGAIKKHESVLRSRVDLRVSSDKQLVSRWRSSWRRASR